ncbi:MAG: hypothetical protein KTR23_01865 [Rhodospirillales bacterium]|nr:hypothetical protein [Rhodospirillales bacterium]
MTPALVIKVDLKQHEDELASLMFGGGLYAAGARALTHQGVYRAMSFYHPRCDGALSVVLLDRNAEAANILDSFPGESGFYYDGTRYEEFPYWSYLFGKVTGNVPVVIAYREAGDCQLHEILAK